jgi:hypothetical protein
LFPRPFHRIVPTSVATAVAQEAIDQKVGWIALNNTEASALAEPLRALLPECRLLFLSHGAEITDELNAIRLSPTSVPPHRRSARWLGQSLLAQMAQRVAIDATLCISADDVLFEHWLGARQVTFLPRRVEPRPLVHNPVPGRVGTVATLDHVPNRQGIEDLAHHLNDTGVQFRVVGGPEDVGLLMQSTHSCIHYCGRLSDCELEEEASTWCAFVNPIFCQARGASTKVATALGWGLPLLSTPFGVRGYVWNADLLPLAHSPIELAHLIVALLNSNNDAHWRRLAHEVAALSPKLDESASALRAFLETLP